MSNPSVAHLPPLIPGDPPPRAAPSGPTPGLDVPDFPSRSMSITGDGPKQEFFSKFKFDEA